MSDSPHFRYWLEMQEIPRRLYDASLDAGEQTPAVLRVRQFIETEIQQGCCLALMGPTGVGKTYAMVAALLSSARANGGGGQFWYVPAFCSAILNREEGREVFLSARNTGLLALDDFGVEYLKAGGMLEALVDELIWYREGNNLATILTTNLMPDQMKERLSDRIVDRLRGDWGRLFVCVGESFRGKA